MSIKNKNKITRRKLLKHGLYGTVAAGLSPALWVSGCSKLRPNKMPNILFISIDTLRKDRCSAYGYHRDTTPNLRKLADNGSIFDSAYAPTPTTAPSHATMFTSLYPITHQFKKNGAKLSKDYTTLAEYLNASGYHTAAVMGSFVLNSKFGFAQGFEFFDDKFEFSTATCRREEWGGIQVDEGFDQRANITSQKAIDFLQKYREKDRPFFLFVHYFDPHSPYVPPEPFNSKFAPQKNQPTPLDKFSTQYDGEVAFVDYEIGNIIKTLEYLGRKDDTLIIVTSDHGEGLGQHDNLVHTVNIYEEAVRVPLIFHWPKHILRDRIINAPVELVDLMPTIFDLIGITDDKFSFQGQSLSNALCNGSKLDLDRPVYLHRPYFKGLYLPLLYNKKIWLKGEKFAIKINNWKYIEAEEENTKELFDLNADSLELKNIYSSFPEKAAEFKTRLEKWKKEYGSQIAEQNIISDEDRMRLETLGYVN
jgi:arylsulfatase A-like enzyme